MFLSTSITLPCDALYWRNFAPSARFDLEEERGEITVESSTVQAQVHGLEKSLSALHYIQYTERAKAQVGYIYIY